MKAYLAWPVKFNPYAVTGVAEGHITFKYIGDVEKALGFERGAYNPPGLITDALVSLVADLLAGEVMALSLYEAKWVPEVFNPQTRVMVIEGVRPRRLYTLREKFGALREEDFPTWRPHITLPSRVWAHVSRSGNAIDACIESVGPLTLYVDHKPVATFA